MIRLACFALLAALVGCSAANTEEGASAANAIETVGVGDIQAATDARAIALGTVVAVHDVEGANLRVDEIEMSDGKIDGHAVWVAVNGGVFDLGVRLTHLASATMVAPGRLKISGTRDKLDSLMRTKTVPVDVTIDVSASNLDVTSSDDSASRSVGVDATAGHEAIGMVTKVTALNGAAGFNARVIETSGAQSYLALSSMGTTKTFALGIDGIEQIEVASATELRLEGPNGSTYSVAFSLHDNVPNDSINLAPLAR